MADMIRVTLKQGVIATPIDHKQTVLGLGLKRTNRSRVLKKTLPVLGMINKVSYLLEVSDPSEIPQKLESKLNSVPEYKLGKNLKK